MKITFLCSSAEHPIVPYLSSWSAQNIAKHDIELVRKTAEVSGGEILFLVSCVEKVSSAVRSQYDHTLVLHASDLPDGRGWSPHVWSIVEGAESITLSLLEAEDAIDSGRIWKKMRIDVPSHWLWDEINAALFQAEISLIEFAVTHADTIKPEEQDPLIEPTYRRRRTPEDSAVDPTTCIASQFDLIRVCDPKRFPAYFDLRGCRYKIELEKLDG